MSRLPSNILYNLAGQTILLVLGLISVKYVYGRLGEDALGIIYFSSTLNAILCGLLEKGLYATTVREISTHEDMNSGYIRDFMRTSATFCFAIYIFFVFLVFAAAPILAEKWIILKSMDLGTATDIIKILGTSSLLAFPRSFYASAFRGLQRMEYNNIIDVAVTFIQQIGTIMLLIHGSGIYMVSAWFGFCYFIGFSAYLFSASLFFSWSALVPGFSKDVFRKVKPFAARTAAISLLAVIHKQTDKVVISKILPIVTIGYFGFAHGIASRAGIIASAVSNAAYPSFSEIFEHGTSAALKQQYFKLHEFISFITLPLFAAIVFAAMPLTTYIFDESIAHLLFLPFLFLAIGFYLNGTLNLQYQLTLAIGRPAIGMRANFFALFIVTPTTIFLTYYWSITGAAFSWIIFNVYIYIYTLPIVCREFFKENLFKWYAREIRFLLFAIVVYGAIITILIQRGASSMISMAAAYLVGTMIFFSVAAFFLGPDLRCSLLANFRKLLGVPNAG